MNQRANRTFVCSVLFLDLVGYSTRPVTEQLKLKQRLSALLREALQDIAELDRIVLDVAGGVVVSFLGQPTDPLFVALDLSQGMALSAEGEPAASVRIGINLGPVRVTSDFGGQLNVVGDGIGVAERIMSFAEGGHILVSRSYYEVLCRHAPDFERIFRFEGNRTDRQVREHSVFMVDPDGAMHLRSRARTTLAGRAAGQIRRLTGSRRVAPPDPATVSEVRTEVLVAALALATVIVATAWTVRSLRPSTSGEASSPLPVLTAPPVGATAVVRSVPASGGAAVQSVPDRLPLTVSQVASNTALSAVIATAPPIVLAPTVVPRPVAPVAVQSAPVVAPESVITLVIAPWGEVYLDGQLQGVSPPLKKLNVSPGRHEIEIRNTSFPVFRKSFEAKSGVPVRIEHRY